MLSRLTKISRQVGAKSSSHERRGQPSDALESQLPRRNPKTAPRRRTSSRSAPKVLTCCLVWSPPDLTLFSVLLQVYYERRCLKRAVSRTSMLKETRATTATSVHQRLLDRLAGWKKIVKRKKRKVCSRSRVRAYNFSKSSAGTFAA
jgi:hypothetical protein